MGTLFLVYVGLCFLVAVVGKKTTIAILGLFSKFSSSYPAGWITPIDGGRKEPRSSSRLQIVKWLLYPNPQAEAVPRDPPELTHLLHADVQEAGGKGMTSMSSLPSSCWSL